MTDHIFEEFELDYPFQMASKRVCKICKYKQFYRKNFAHVLIIKYKSCENYMVSRVLEE